jgi:hypothetical protein
MKSELIIQMVTNIFWIIVGVVITRILDKPFERYQRKFVYWFRGVISRFRSHENHELIQDDFRLGKWIARWVVVEGSSSDPYTPDNVVCQLDPRPLQLPEDRLKKKLEIEREQAHIKKITGHEKYHNGPTVALEGIGRGQIGPTEEPFLVLRLRPSDYYNFLATSISLNDVVLPTNKNKITVRDKYLRNQSFKSPMPEFAAALSVNLSLITSDGYILATKRAIEGIGGYQGHVAPAINECINLISDRSASGTLSLLATVQRGASSELNIDVSDDEVLFFTVGVDPQWYFWGVTGLVRSKSFTRADLLSRRSVGSKENWEASELYFLPHDPFGAVKLMRDISKTEKWQPIGVVCLIQTLISEFGIKTVEQALRKYPQ